MNTARLIIADSERNADLYYATRFLAPDAFIFVQIQDRKYLIMSELELDRAKATAQVDEVRSYSRLVQDSQKRGITRPSMVDVVDTFLQEQQVKTIEVPANFGVSYADALRQQGYTLEPVRDPFFAQRVVKTKHEIGYIEQAIRATEYALERVIALIRHSTIGANDVLMLSGKPLTAELLRTTMHLTMLEQECLGQHTIVACGEQAVDPHNEGTGALKAHQPIVIDVFPQHTRTRYFADMTRTVVRGKASDKVKAMFQAVLDGQQIAFDRIRDGADGAEIHRAIQQEFEKRGFMTGIIDGRMQGFFHGTGHGVGIEIHEAPRIGSAKDILRTNMVVTVEPGLYYVGAGGVRLEDIVVVTPDGCRNLNLLPKELEV